MTYLFRLLRWWQYRWIAKQRKVDLDVLWPACKAQAKDLGSARYAFMVHMDFDPAYNNMTEEEKVEYVNNLV